MEMSTTLLYDVCKLCVNVHGLRSIGTTQIILQPREELSLAEPPLHQPINHSIIDYTVTHSSAILVEVLIILLLIHLPS